MVYFPENKAFSESAVLDEYFEKKPQENYEVFNYGQSFFPAERILFSGLPLPEFHTLNQSYKVSNKYSDIGRSMLFVAVGETYSISVYVIDRSRKKIIVDSVSLM